MKFFIVSLSPLRIKPDSITISSQISPYSSFIIILPYHILSYITMADDRESSYNIV
jgi:hypothetical protein